MPNVLGFSTAPPEGGTFTRIVKYDARSGRMFRMDRIENNGNFANEAVDITQSFKAIVDLEKMETGYMLFAPGAAPHFKLVPIGNEFPDRPSDKHKHGVRLMIKLAKDCGGDKPIREFAGTSNAFLAGMEAVVHAVSGGEGHDHPGKLPVIVLEKTTPVRSGTGEHSSTNYQPTFKIVGWAPRGDLGGVAPSDGGPPATGSTQVDAPKADETVSADDF